MITNFPDLNIITVPLGLLFLSIRPANFLVFKREPSILEAKYYKSSLFWLLLLFLTFDLTL
jgi:hypothetical protein